MRRIPSMVTAVVIATTLGTLIASCSGSGSAHAQAQALVAFGGPAGWSPDPLRHPATDDTSIDIVDGVPVTMTAGDQPAGARITWLSPVADGDGDIDARCGELVAWFDDAAQAWPSTIDTSTMKTACEKDAAGSGHPILAAGAGPAHGAYGRVTYAASVDDGELVATLEFNATA